MRRLRAWAEVVFAVLAAVAAVATAVYPTWFEAFFEESPDSGSGALEWVVAIALALAAVVLSLLARRDFRRYRTAVADPA